MFKRLGRSTPSPGVDPASLLPPVAPSTHPGYSPPLSSSPRQSGEPLRPASPIANGSYQDGTGVSGTYGSVDRVTLQKSLRALEGLLVELNEYRDRQRR
ncbi:hypothetical protein BT69DRAFT_547165 [Atractiella rhizophila]|nr:hypothetical protein BT69DRAFT_547165 [Atractiella rhizophila]